MYYTFDGGLATELTDNAAHSQWFYSWNTVIHSFHAETGGSTSDNESTILGKDGYTYVSDVDPSGNTIASAKYVTSTGTYVSSSNWAPATTNDESPGPSVPPGSVMENLVTYQMFNVTDGLPPGDPGNPDVVAAGTKSSAASSYTEEPLQSIGNDLRADFSVAAGLTKTVSAATSVLPNHFTSPQSNADSILSVSVNNHQSHAAIDSHLVATSSVYHYTATHGSYAS